MRALVLDDDPLMLTLMQHVVAHRGYEVLSYANPTLCPIMASACCPCGFPAGGCPDLILTDVNMPSVNGIEFVEDLKRRGCTCRHIAMISGDWSDANLAKARECGARVFAKPFGLRELESWLTQVAENVA
jgi:DNA-binding response OmpR family regulator